MRASPCFSNSRRNCSELPNFIKGQAIGLSISLGQFVGDTFHPPRDLDPDLWPELEDLFTCVDLSANTGHHLGGEHSPAFLRTVRRALIARMIRMLRQSF